MNISYDKDKYLNEIIDLAYNKYCEEIKFHLHLEKMPKSDFQQFFLSRFAKQKGVVAIENNNCVGFLLYSSEKSMNGINCNIPLWGYGSASADAEKNIAFLFQNLADRIADSVKVNFSIHLYAHDYTIQRLFSYLQFGIIASKAVRRIAKIEYSCKVDVRKISKEELLQRWNEIWGLLKQLLLHLQKSPVFYPCKEFTESNYKSFLTDTGTTVYIAEDGNRIVGLIESNADNFDLFLPDSNSGNIGEAFVIPEYRGLQVAQTLLNCVENDLLAKNKRYDWVEHGTANPAARGFWSKYFDAVEYEFVRSIDCVPNTN